MIFTSRGLGFLSGQGTAATGLCKNSNASPTRKKDCREVTRSCAWSSHPSRNESKILYCIPRSDNHFRSLRPEWVCLKTIQPPHDPPAIGHLDASLKWHPPHRPHLPPLVPLEWPPLRRSSYGMLGNHSPGRVRGGSDARDFDPASVSLEIS